MSRRACGCRGSHFGGLYDLENDPLEMVNLGHDPQYAAVKGQLPGAMVMAMIDNRESAPLPTDFA